MRRGRSPDYLHGYVEGYWDGWEWALTSEGDGEGGTAAGGADASSSDSAPDPAARKRAPLADARGVPAGSRAPSDSALPAIHQPAAPPEGEGDG